MKKSKLKKTFIIIKTMRVLKSCKTAGQAKVARKYAQLADPENESMDLLFALFLLNKRFPPSWFKFFQL